MKYIHTASILLALACLFFCSAVNAAPKPEPTKNTALTARVQPVMRKLHIGSLYNYKVVVVDADELNAWVTRDQTIYLTSALVNFCQSDDEIAAVIAHEMGHLANAHFDKMDAKARQWEFAIQQGALDANVATTTAKIVKVGIVIFSKDQENEADKTGFQTLCQDRFDYTAMSRLFTRLEAEKNKEIRMPSFLSTHPPFSERVELINRLDKRPVDYPGLMQAIRRVDPAPFTGATPPAGYKGIVIEKDAIGVFVRTSGGVALVDGKIELPSDSKELVVVITQPEKLPKKSQWKAMVAFEDLVCACNGDRVFAIAIPAKYAAGREITARSISFINTTENILCERRFMPTIPAGTALEESVNTALSLPMDITNPYAVPPPLDLSKATEADIKAMKELKKQNPLFYQIMVETYPEIEQVVK